MFQMNFNFEVLEQVNDTDSVEWPTNTVVRSCFIKKWNATNLDILYLPKVFRFCFIAVLLPRFQLSHAADFNIFVRFHT